MKFLGFAKRLKDTSALVQELRDHGINVNGPFRRRNGTFIYSLAGCVVTERELPDLPNTGKLDPAGVPELTAKITRSGV
jgi:hypothetical protein